MEILIYVLKSAVLITIFYGVYRLFLQRETFFTANRYFLLVGILVSVLFPAIILKQVIYLETAPPAQDLFEDQFIQTVAMNQEAGFDWWRAGLLVYLGGCFLMLLLFFRKLGIVLYFFRKNPVRTHDGFKYIDVKGLKNPFSFFNYIAFDKNEHSREELELILHHERVHVRQCHTLDMLLMQLLLILQWFNPFIWFYRKSVEENLEFLADSAVNQKVADSKKYQLTLVKVSTSGRTPALAHTFYHSFIKKRIIMLNKQSSQNHKKFKMLLILPLLGAFMWSFNVQETIKYKEPATEVTQHISDPGGLEEEKIVKGEAISNNLEEETVVERAALAKKDVSGEIPSAKNQETKLKPFKKIIRSTTSNEEINAIAKNLKEEFKVDLSVENLEFNGDGHINGIKLTMKDLSTNNMTTTQFNGAKPIPDLLLYRTEEGTFGISSALVNTSQGNNRIQIREMKEFTEAERGEMKERKKERESREKIIEVRVEEMEKRREEMEERREEMEQRREEMRTRADEMMERAKNREINASENKESESISLSRTNALFLVDGKEVSETELKDISPNAIESVTVLKGEKARELYKERMDGKEGVILIVLKKK